MDKKYYYLLGGVVLGAIAMYFIKGTWFNADGFKIGRRINTRGVKVTLEQNAGGACKVKS